MKFKDLENNDIFIIPVSKDIGKTVEQIIYEGDGDAFRHYRCCYRKRNIFNKNAIRVSPFMNAYVNIPDEEDAIKLTKEYRKYKRG